MFALKAGQTERAVDAAFARWRAAVDGFVLPRLLRRPARLVARLTSGDVEPPRFAATIASALLLGSATLYGAALGGHMPSVVKEVTARTGFAIDEIRISGNRETSEIDVFERIGLDGWTSLVGFDVDDARARILSLPWVQSASVRKVYPAALEVRIVEKEPFAIWQHGRQLTLIEEDGSAIGPFSGARHRVLPLVIGLDAAESSSEFLARVAEFPELASRVKGYIRVSQRRWDLRLENGMTIKLPEHDEIAAIGEVVALDREHGLLSRDIESVDLRFGDRVVVRLSPDAATAREATLKQRLGRNYRPPEQRI